MKTTLIAILLTSAFIAPALADKPEWAGKGKPTQEQKDAHAAAMEAKEALDERDELDDEKKEKKEKKENSIDSKGLEKQTDKKSQQIQNEQGKGSDKGQAARQENSKKWWKFWGE